MNEQKLNFNESRAKLLGEERIIKLLLRFSGPAIIGMLVTALYNFVDSLFISRYVGPDALAGVSVTFPISLISMAISMLVGLGSTTLLSIRLGEGKHEEGEKIIGNGFTLIIILSSLFSILGLLFLDQLLKLFGVTGDALPYARDYLSIILWGNVFNSVGYSMNNYIRAEGSPRIAMFSMLIGAIVNIALDAYFIIVLGWGVKGGAFATVLSQIISMTWVLSCFLGGKSTLKLRKKNMPLDPKIVGRVLKLGLAPCFLQLAAALMNTVLNISIREYGGALATTYQASIGAVSRISTLLLMPIFGINQGAQPIIGFNYGAKNYTRVKQTLKMAIGFATCIVIVGYLITRFFPHVLINLFIDKNNDTYDPSLFVEYGKKAIFAYYFFMPIVGYQIVSSNFFQAIGKPLKAATLSLSRQLLFLIPLIITLPIFFDKVLQKNPVDGIVWSIPTADILSVILTTILLIFELRIIRRQELQKM